LGGGTGGKRKRGKGPQQRQQRFQGGFGENERLEATLLRKKDGEGKGSVEPKFPCRVHSRTIPWQDVAIAASTLTLTFWVYNNAPHLLEPHTATELEACSWAEERWSPATNGTGVLVR
jgi:hypothetical protein